MGDYSLPRVLELENEEPITTYSRPSKDYSSVTPQYVPHRGLVRYSQALKHLIPIRKQNTRRNVLNVDNAGFLSFVTYSWMTEYIWKAYKQGLTVDDIPQGSPQDACDYNAQRMEILWQEEVAARGERQASFGRVIWRFARTRFILAAFTFSISCVMGFLSPTIFMRKLLEFSEDENSPWMVGAMWAFCLCLSEILRTLFFAMCWSISYRTATRLRAACLALVYRKLISLHSLGSKSAGEVINMFANDGPRLFYMVVFAPMIIGGPLVALCGVAYILIILGPWALMGMLTFTLFYPVQYGLSYLCGYFRARTISFADVREKIMQELLNSIKLIKMYAWEDAFAHEIQRTRKDEIREIRNTAYCQSLGIIMAPTVPVISGIVTFVAHILSGGTLTASQAFSVLTLKTKLLRLGLSTIREGFFHLIQAQVVLPRFKAFPVLSFTSKQLRMALKHLRESCTAILEGLVSIPRFKAFPLVTVLTSQLRSALLNVQYGTENLMIGMLVFRRIQELLLMEELKVEVLKPKDPETALEMKDSSFIASTSQTQTDDEAIKNSSEKQKLNAVETPENVVLLSNITFSIPKGALIGVCGAVGTGKTSLLLASLGQLKKTNGALFRDGSVAYVSQQAWIQNATLKDNILFGEVFNAKKYINTVFCCALNDDIHLLPGGDETEIGERGVNLSGGQKQRVALARALYANRDIYLLDDPLSAVDAHVGAHIVEHALLGQLRTRTVVLVTHQVAHLSLCDQVLVLKDGQIVGQGTHQQLLDRSPDYRMIVQATEFSDVNLSNHSGSELKLDQSTPSNSPKIVTQPSNINIKKIPPGIIREEQIRGEVKDFAFRAYMDAAGGPLVCFIAILTILLHTGTNAFSSYWLALWIKEGSGTGNTTIDNATIDDASNVTIPINSGNILENPDLNYYVSVYAGTIGFIILSSLIRIGAVTRASIRAGKRLHDSLFAATISSPIRYFETTPTGRTLNMFARDLEEVESRLPVSLETMLQSVFVVAFAFLFITMVFPWFLLPLIVLAVLYYYISKIFRVAIRDLQRIDNISRAPVLSSVLSSVQGLSTIHAFEKQKDFVGNFAQTFDENSTCLFMSCNAMRWLAIRLDSISVCITCITALLVIILKNQVPAALAGLALNYAMHISGVFQYTIRLLSETEQRFISVERIQNSIMTLAPEGRSASCVKPPSGWPTRGAIRFKDVCLSYSDDLPFVLDSFTLSVRGGEKLGVVGRTGAGKSSIITALYRLCELSRGSIFIDGVDITELELKELRNAMAVIPQDPVLFNGSFRHNLDPFVQYTDVILWDAIRKTQLERKVKNLEGGLDALVGEGGECLSLGERQLLCLARALLRGSKILLLDEATASIDPETEHLIQQTIKTEFASCTVITIAHRLATVTSTNRVLLMDHGTIVELDDPNVLLSNRNSEFAKLAAAVGFIPAT